MEAIIGQLVIRFEGDVLQRTSIRGGVLRLGRLPANDVVLPHPHVSRNHAELRWDETSGLTLTDLGSTHGTLLNGEEILPNQPHVITPGSTFQIGPYLITFEPADLPVGYVAEEDGGPGTPDITDVEVSSPGMYLPSVEALRSSGDGYASDFFAQPRASYPVQRAAGPLSRYLLDLPALYQENDFLGRFLLIFESIWEPIEQRQDAIHMYFDPHTCPSSFLPWLASWFDLSLSEHWPEARRRRLLAEATTLYRWRGTRYGLVRMIELCTGLTPQVTESTQQPFVFHVQIRIPPDHEVEAEFIEKIILSHKPAHAGYILEIER